MSQSFDTPILLIVFRRPDLTRRLLDILADLRPTRLFVAADAPRLGRPDEAEACRQTRALFDNLGWNCRVERLFADKNLGCKHGPLQGINWVFDQVDRAIILEDDTQPHPTFFRFAAELLERYLNDDRIAMVSGANFLPPAARVPASYYFAHFGQTWAWGTWRRAWRHYDIEMTAWPAFRQSGRMREVFPLRIDRIYRRKCFDAVYNGTLTDAWDFQWTLTQLVRGTLSAVPARNLVTNVGAGAMATHTTSAESDLARPACAMEFPLVHPDPVAPDRELERAEARVFVRMRDPRPGILRHLPHTGIVRALRRMLGKRDVR